MTRTLTSLALFLALAAILYAQDGGSTARIEHVLKDWKTRQERLQSVRYKLDGTEESMGKPLMEGAPPPIPGTRPVKVTVLIDLVNKRYRLDEDLGIPSKARDRYVRRVTTRAYNGKIAQMAVPRENEERSVETPDISIAKGDLTMSRVDSYLVPVFLAHGLVPTEDSPLGPGRFPTNHEVDDFEIKGSVSHSGRSCLILTTPDLSDEFWIDPQRQSAAIRQIHWQGKNPWYRTDIDHQQTPHGWLPQKWVIVNTIGGEVRNITRLNVEAIEANPILREEDFTLLVKPGMVIKINDYPSSGKGLDPSQPAKTTLQVDSEGNLSEVKKEGFRTVAGVQLTPESGSKAWWWIGILAIAAVAVSFCFLIWRRQQCSGRSSPDVTPH